MAPNLKASNSSSSIALFPSFPVCRIDRPDVRKRKSVCYLDSHFPKGLFLSFLPSKVTFLYQNVTIKNLA